MTDIPFCPESIVNSIFNKLSKDTNKENQENGMRADRCAQKADILVELNQNVPEQFIEVLSETLESELGEVSEVFENDFLMIFNKWITNMQSGESEGRYYDQSFAEICSNSLNGSFNDVSSINDHLGSLSHEKLTDLKGDYLIHSVFSSRESRASSNRSDSFNHRSSRLNSPEKRCNMTPYILSPIGRSKSFQNLHGHQFHGKIYDESFSIGTYSGLGGSPQRPLKEATSMELFNSKLNTEISCWKTKAKQFQADYEKLLVTNDQLEKELKSKQQKLESSEKQVKMLRITNDNLNADLDNLNQLREKDQFELTLKNDLEHQVKSIREENEKAWNLVDDKNIEKTRCLAQIEDEKEKLMLFRQETSLLNQEMIREQKELIRQRECQEKRAVDAETRLIQFNKDIISLTRERDELKSNISELEGKINQTGEIIQFADQKCSTTLLDEFDQSNAYKSFKLEEIGEVKLELDQTRLELTQTETERDELEDKIRRMHNELKLIGNIQKVYIPKPPDSFSVGTNTVKVKEKMNFSNQGLGIRDWLMAANVLFIAILLLLVGSTSVPWLEINCPGMGKVDFF